MRSSRVFTYAAGWAVLTVLAAGAVWWGLRPLLVPMLLPVAVPPSTPPPSASSAAAVILTPSPVVSVKPSAPPPKVESAKPTPSMYDGWAFENGIFTRTFDTVGGRAVVRVLEGRVELVSSAANSGFQELIQQSPDQPQRLVVRYFNATKDVIIDAMWWEGRPYVEVTIK